MILDYKLNKNMYQDLSENNKKQLFGVIVTVLVFLAIFLLAETLGAFKQYMYIGRATPTVNVITITGHGEVTAIPDTGSFNFSVIEMGKTVTLAEDTASKKVNAIIDAIKAMGIDDKDIKTTSYNSYPKYEYQNVVCGIGAVCSQSKQVLTGYEVSQVVSVKIHKTIDAGAVLTKVGTLGAQNISELDFVIDDMTAVNALARDKAIADAKTKAEALGKSLGIHLSKIINFSESGEETPPIYYGKTMNAESVGLSVPTTPQIPTGENTIVSNVTITYEID